jgi:hypothetical protein
MSTTVVPSTLRVLCSGTNTEDDAEVALTRFLRELILALTSESGCFRPGRDHPVVSPDGLGASMKLGSDARPPRRRCAQSV